MRTVHDSTRNNTPENLDSRIGATAAVYWVYHSIGRFRGKGPNSDHWQPRDPAGRELVRELEKLIRPGENWPEDPGGMEDEISGACSEWVEQRYGDTPRAAQYVEYLTQLCYSKLGEAGSDEMFYILPLLEAIRRDRRADHDDAKEIRALNKALRIVKPVSPAAVAALEKLIAQKSQRRRDPVFELIARLFSVNNKFWGRAFNKHGKVRSKKLPVMKRAGDLLNQALQALPEKIHLRSPQHRPQGLQLTAAERDDLVTRVLKAVFPQAKAMTASSRRALRSYDKGMARRPESKRGRHGRV